MNLLKELKKLRACDTPLVFIKTPDAVALRDQLSEKLNGSAPQFCWDCVRGLAAVNRLAAEILPRLLPPPDPALGPVDPAALTRNPVEAMVLLDKLPPAQKDDGSDAPLVWWLNPQRFLDAPQFVQALSNLRESFRGTKRTWVGLGPDATLPPEVQYDVVTMEEEYPTSEQLRVLAERLVTGVGLKVDPKHLDKAARGARGVPAFNAENLLAWSLEESGFDLGGLALRRKVAIESVPGLGLDTAGITLDMIGGLPQVKKMAVRLARMGIGLVLVLDEIEKMLGAAAGDLSGVTMDQLGVLLRAMEDYGWTGIICVGPPGAGKTMFAKAVGSAAQCPTLNWDLGAAKGSLVGQSEQRVRAGLRMARSLAGDGDVLVVATCNKLESIPPELLRRFKLGTVFFDLPDADERTSILALQLAKFGLKPQASDYPDMTGWTGAEIRNCVELAARCKMPLREAAESIVPYETSNREKLEALRRSAAGRWLSASSPGPYRLPEAKQVGQKQRAMTRAGA